jgi:predicted amidophosphoribosyltransferase
VSAEPTPARPGAGAGGTCPLCATPVAPEARRCPECGYTLAGVGARPGAYSRPALWWTVAAFVAVYVLVLAVVAATR